jgi:hypothetical protein
MVLAVVDDAIQAITGFQDASLFDARSSCPDLCVNPGVRTGGRGGCPLFDGVAMAAWPA